MDIKNKNVYDDEGNPVAQAYGIYRYGYHPCIMVQMNDSGEKGFIELDEENIIQKIHDWVRSRLPKGC